MEKKAVKKWKILGIVFFVAVVCGLTIFLFSGKNFTVLKEILRKDATPDEIQDSIGKLGYSAYLVVGILAMLQVLFTFIPAEPLHVVSGMGFGLWKGVLICFIGILLGNTIIYLLNKFYGQKLKHFFETNVDFDFHAAKASSKVALIVIILYCLPAIPYGIICFFAASIGMKYPKYILVTGIGSIPSLLLDVGLGHVTMAVSWIVSLLVFVIILILLILMFKYKAQIFAKINKMIHKSREKEKNRVGKFNPFIYNVIGSALCGIVKRKIKLKFKNNVGELEKPSVVLCNHGSFFDFVYVSKLIKKDRPHFAVARMYFHNKLLGKIISGTGAFPKSMFTNDVESVKNCLKVVSNKEVLAMMPEARLSTAGKFEDIQDSTYKFLKKMNVAVYTIKINGSYLAKPKWGNGIRKGALVEAEINQLFKAGELETLSLDEIKEKVENALIYNEWEWLEKHPEVEYKHKKIAEGLENILSICPKCNKKYSLSAKKNIITCNHCGLNVEVDKRYQLHGVDFKNIAEWYEWQTEEVRKEIKSNPDFCLESKVELRHLSGGKKSSTRHSGNGICKFTKEGLRYTGTEDGKEIDKLFTIESIYRVLFGAGEDFEIYENKELYYFVPEEKKSCVMWYIVSGLFKE